MIDTQRVKGQMVELGMSSHMLAVAAGVRQPLVESILQGRCTDTEKIQAICTALDLDFDDVANTEEA